MWTNVYINFPLTSAYHPVGRAEAGICPHWDGSCYLFLDRSQRCLPHLKVRLVLGCTGRAVVKASPALDVLESSAQTGLAVSSVENRNDIQQGKGAAGADGVSLVL